MPAQPRGDDMNAIAAIEKDLREVAAKRKKLESEIDALQRREDRLRTALTVLGEYGEATKRNGTAAIDDPDLSIREAAVRFLGDHEPMSVGNLAKAMLNAGFPYEGDAEKLESSLRGSLYSRRGAWRY